MFFATPQYDMDSYAWPVFADRVLRCVAPRKSEGQTPTQRMLNDLADNRPSMMKIAEDFKPLQPQFAFVSFLEESKMDGYDTVVGPLRHFRLSG